MADLLDFVVFDFAKSKIKKIIIIIFKKMLLIYNDAMNGVKSGNLKRFCGLDLCTRAGGT